MGVNKLVIIGGSAAGAKAAARARRLDQNAEITIIQQDPDLSMASCGYPYYIGGVFNERKMLLAAPNGVVRDPGFFDKTKKIRAMVETRVDRINRSAKTVSYTDLRSGSTGEVAYDKLVICTGASAARPPIPGLELDGVTTLLSMADTDYLRKVRDEKKLTRAVVLGGGLIGVEACEALRESGLEVTLVEAAPQILTFLDPQMSMLVANHMRAKGVEVITSMAVKELLGEAGKLAGVRLADGTLYNCDIAVVATGVKPNVALVADAGLSIGELGGVTVDKHMTTSDPDIYAAGDCVEVDHLITGRKVLAPMGDLANLQGRVVGENIVSGNVAAFPGTSHTAICKVFDFAAGATGLTEKSAAASGMVDVETVINASPDKPGFMGAGLLISKILVQRDSGRVLGYQCVGNGDVSRQLATAAMAVQGKMTLDVLVNLDLPYAPPFSLAIDHFIASAHIMQNKLAGRLKTVSAAEVHERVASGETLFMVDGRGPDEHEVLRLGIGETYIPLGALRSSLDKLPADKSTPIITFCKVSLRGYETALVLENAGYTNVRVMEGGIMAWPYKRER